MEQIKTLKQAWIFDNKGVLKQSKSQSAKQRADQIYSVAKQALRYVSVTSPQETIKRISFVNKNQEWTITMSDKQQIVVMHKQE